ncbi:class I SAM-dependent methyltransferase [Bacillus sp. ISL-45]|uniref:class I SAM-dependent methyltransferase n=1 Tax=Bacillus sp. ISL-45 TaxID=2819128 RepID=UPI001BE73CDD|nr:class I SAM-dependent methyltransferase [Bacillus sp. ISL-45]MBT2663183.1 class I SAM-dependent methyltransferase [Bacillus sp. ISL-45]
MNNTWNRFIYKCAAPFYDRLFNSGIFLKARKQIFKDIDVKSGSKILFVGVGTGADLPYLLNNGHEITAIDYSEDMLRMAQETYRDSSITFLRMDAQHLDFEKESFDFVIGSLILSVVPDPQQAFREIIRVLKSNGRFLIFDKFVPANKKVPVRQRLLRPLVKLFGTDIGLDFNLIHAPVSDESIILQDEEVMLNGLYRRITGVKRREKGI